jgi:APA family basic amino acid/polyamine antiporter
MTSSSEQRLAASGAVTAPNAPRGTAVDDEPHLVRGLGVWDATLLTVGSIVGTGIFLTTSDMARVLPHAGLILLVWLAGGLLTLAGALTYAELGVMFPRAGGQYQYLKEAYGPFWGFLFGWSGFLVGMSGGNAAIAVGFGEYLGGFLPWFSTQHVLAAVPIGGWTWTLNGVQVAAALAILLLTAINHVGLRAGAGAQNVLTAIKLAAMVGLVVFGLTASVPAARGAADAASTAAAALPTGTALLAAFGVAMIAGLWTYDGWYGVTCAAGELKNPARNLPRGLIGGTLVVVLLYLLLNVVYFRALPVETIAGAPRVAELAAGTLFGPWAARLMTAAVLVSSFGCLSASLLYTSRIYQPMAADGLFFRALGRVHPKHHVPVASLWAQGVWTTVLALSGTYQQLYTYAVFSLVLFHVMTAAAVIVLRRRRPELPRPYRTWGYPVVPVLFIGACLLLVGNTLVAKPVESLLGTGLLVLGIPAYVLFRRRARISAEAS